MSGERPWDSAGKRVETDAAGWYQWCDRHGWGFMDAYQHKFWSRKQFRAALAVMPKDHPDRWKYKVGRSFAPPGSAFIFFAVFGTILPAVGSIPLSINSGLFIWLPVFLILGTLWGVRLTRMYRALST